MNQSEARLKQWGVTLIFIGLGSFVLPMIGLQFRLLNFFGGSPAAGMFIAAVGGVLLALGLIKARAQSSPVAKGSGGLKERPVPASSTVPHSQGQPINVTGIHCAACGSENAQGDQFCGSCGAVLAQTATPSAPSCTHCGTPLSPDERFCGECGDPVSAQALPSQPQASVSQTSATPPRWRRVAAILGTIILLVITVVFYTKQEPIPANNNQPAPQPTTQPLQQSKEQPGVPAAPRRGADQYGRTSNNQKAISPAGDVDVPTAKSRSTPPPPRLGPQAFEPQPPQDRPNLPPSPGTTIPEIQPPVKSASGTITFSKTTPGTASSAIDLRGIWKGESYCPDMNLNAPFTVNVTDQGQNTFSGTFDFNNTPFRGNVRGDQVTLEHHIGTQQEQRWDGRITQVASGLKMEGSTAMVAVNSRPCHFELYKQ